MEVLVVVVVLSLLVALIPRLSVGLQRARLRQAADQLALSLTEAHQLAIHEGQVITITLNTQRLTYTRGDGLVRTLPHVVEHLTLMRSDAIASENDAVIHFFADGSSNGCEIRLYGGPLAETLSLRWLTGKVERGR